MVQVIPDGAEVDLSLIRLRAGALIFPALPDPGGDFDFTKPRNPRNFSKEFARRTDYVREQARKADLPSFGKTRFHDLRGIHSTALLDAGIPVHTVAQRIGDDPAVLLRNYAKRKRSKKANELVTTAIAAFALGLWENRLWVQRGSKFALRSTAPCAKCLTFLRRKGGRVV
ncbi:hypothetical protein [Bradyrhizobium genosp. P]|uniref:hypothetical protein n=1 Tax=Bradyrhizobium genosp. P TaxID=83641 RepID=UPI003CEF9358